MAEHASAWNIPPDNLQLLENEVHVWRASLNVPAFVLSSLQQALTGEEIARAARFYFEKDRKHWTVARGVLRILLSRYLKTHPHQFSFCYNDYGKPLLEKSAHSPQLQFNISHSHELALYAFTPAREIGVDVEYMRSNLDYMELAEHTFSAYENEMLQALPTEMRREAFFLCWTRKEAYIKARGKGLSMPLKEFDLSLKPGEPARLLHSREDPR